MLTEKVDMVEKRYVNASLTVGMSNTIKIAAILEHGLNLAKTCVCKRARLDNLQKTSIYGIGSIL